MLAALLLSLGLPRCGRADDDDDPPAQRPGWRTTTLWDKLFPSESPPPTRPALRPVPAKVADSRPAPAEKTEAAPKPVSFGASATAVREREERAYLRRQAVCDKLHEIAAQTHDEELERKVRQLDERIWALYAQRTSRLPSADAVVDMDESILDKHLGKADSPALTHSVNGKDRTQAAVQEDKP
jgi:hypothetical protein